MGAREAHARGGGGKEQKRKRLQRKAAAAAAATPAAAVERGRWCESEESLRGLADDGHNDDETRGGGGGGGGGGNLSFIPRFYYVHGTKSCGKGGVELLCFFPSLFLDSLTVPSLWSRDRLRFLRPISDCRFKTQMLDFPSS